MLVLCPAELNKKFVPIFKTGEKCEVDKYQPISIHHLFSKFFEKTVYDRLIII